MSLARGKSKVSDVVGSISLSESSSRRWRYSKNAVARDYLEGVILDLDEEFNPIRVQINKDAAALSARLNGELNDAVRDPGETFFQSFNSNVGSANGVLEDTEDVSGRNVLLANLARYRKDKLRIPERTDGCSITNNFDGKIENAAHAESMTRPPTASLDLSCVICWTEFSPTRGILPCGHRFCFSCIKKWAEHVASMRTISTCPLCMASFASISKVEGAATNDQKIYSQTIPSNSSTKNLVQIVGLQQVNTSRSLYSVQRDCCGCHCREPEESLVWCDRCQSRCIHSFCLDLDPILFPWICVPCKEREMFHRSTR